MNNLYTYLIKQDTWNTIIDALTKNYPISGYYDDGDVRITINYTVYMSYTTTVKASMWYNALEHYSNKENNNINILLSTLIW